MFALDGEDCPECCELAVDAWERMTLGGLRIAPRGCEDAGEWIADCLKWRGELLNGYHAHWCAEWDGLPVDETTVEEFGYGSCCL